LLYGLQGGTQYSFDPAAVGDNKGTPLIANGGQNSDNLMFPDFGGAANGMTGLYDPNAPGLYYFELEVFGDVAGAAGPQLLKTVAINVNVASAPDAGSTALLLGLGFAGLAAFGYRRGFAFGK
jgi:hypothetical protein